MTLYGTDVSSYQPGYTPAANVDFVFIKSTEGTSYQNPERTVQAKNVRAKKLQLGWYHFLHHGNIDAQVDYFLTHTDIQAGDLLWCDWEQEGCTTADKDQWIKAVQKRMPGHRVGLYCNVDWWLNHDTSSFYGDALWIAAYQSGKPNLQAPFKFWQYTSSPIDQNHGYFDSLANLKAWATGKDTEPDGSSTSTAEQPPTKGSIQTPYGQKGTSWASGYHQGDDWHRNAGQAEIGDPIWAVADGTIIYAGDARKDGGQGWGSAFGIHVLNQWDDHGRTSIDAHMSKLHVKTGDRVKVGDLIGEKGATGNVSGPHDHHEQHTGPKWTDPDVKPIYPGRPRDTTSDDNGDASTGDDLDMSEQTDPQKRTKPQTIKADGNYHLLYLEDNGDNTFGWGGGTHEVHARFKFTGASAADELMVRAIRVDLDDKGDQIGDPTVYWAEGLAGGGGDSYRKFIWKWHVPNPPKNVKSRRLRLQAANYSDHDIIVESINTIAWRAKN